MAKTKAGPRGLQNYAGYYLLRRDQVKIWQEDFQYVLSDLARRGLATQGTNPTYNIVKGQWGYDQNYIMNHVIQNLPSPCWALTY